MNAAAPSYTVEWLQGFAVYRLAGGEIELAIVPELGAKIISLKNLRTGREWLWRPAGGLKLFRNQMGDCFSVSPLGGVDECLPTVAPCSCQGRDLPDHGEAWSAAWTVDDNLLKSGILKTSLRLPVSPLEMTRTMELNGNDLRIAYRLANLGEREERFIWAFHPLLQLQDGDELELPPSTRASLRDADWVDAVDSAVPKAGCSKIFARPVVVGVGAIRNRITGDRFEIVWNPLENDALGLWISRGGWHGHHHFAMEPTNAATDDLAEAVRQKRCGRICPFDTVSWELRVRVTS